MAFFDDFGDAITGYPAAKVTLSIVDRTVVAGTASAVNVNEIWSFQVRINNAGNVNMRNLKISVDGQNGTQVALSASGPFSSSVTAKRLDVDAFSTRDTLNFFFKAPATTKPVGTQLVTAHIASWDANLDHILNALSVEVDPPTGSYGDEVFSA